MFGYLRLTMAIFAFCLYFCTAPSDAAGQTAQKLRYSNSPDKVRVVVDLSDEIDIKKEDGFSDRIVVDLGIAGMGKEVKDIIISDPVFRQAKLFQVDKNKLQLDILLNMETQYQVFFLKNPARLVIDVLKSYQIKEDRQIAPGLAYSVHKELIKGSPLRIHTLIADTGKWYVKPILSGGQVLGRDKLTSVAAGVKAAAAVNASYFGSDGWVIGNLKMDGNIISVEKMRRTAFLVYSDHNMEIEPVSYYGELELPGGQKLPVGGINRERLNDELIIYNKEYAQTTHTNGHGYELKLDNKGNVLYTNFQGNSPLAPGELVLSGHGVAADLLKNFQVGDKIAIRQTLGDKGDAAQYVLGAGPRLVDGGRVAVNSRAENFPPDITQGRAPRTAVGLTKDGKIILLVADGRSNNSRGLTLTELAEKLIEYDAIDAMNLDGGGSSEMVIGSKIVNAPSDGQERRISVALGIFARTQ